jgi:hypothetical protein
MARPDLLARIVITSKPKTSKPKTSKGVGQAQGASLPRFRL